MSKNMRINLHMVKTLLNAAEIKLNNLYELRDSHKISKEDFIIQCCEVSGVFSGLEKEAALLQNDSFGLAASIMDQSDISNLKALVLDAVKDTKDSNIDLAELLKRRKGDAN